MSKKTQSARVLLHGNPVATLTLSGNDKVRLIFDEDYRQSSPRAILGQKFEDWNLRRDRISDGMPPWFLHLLPEGALRRYLSRGISKGAEDDLALLTLLGADLPGAVVVEPIAEAPEIRRSAIEEAALNERRSSAKLRFSLAGQQMKFSAILTERLAIPARGQGGDWIVKISDANHTGLARLEKSTMDWAEASGINVPERKLVNATDIDGLPDDIVIPENLAYACRRFDRASTIDRIHMEDFSQVFNTHGRYRDDTKVGASYVAVLRVIRQISSADVREFIRRIAFNIICGNVDDHLKNWSLIYPDRRRARLSPAYDLISMLTYPQYGRHLALHLPGEEPLAGIGLDRFREMARRAGLDAAYVERDVREDVLAILHGWEKCERDLPLSPSERTAIVDHIASLRLVREART